MSTPERELPLDEVPGPPLYRLVDGSGEPVYESAEVSGEEAAVGTLFASAELARAFSEEAEGVGLPALSGLLIQELREADDGYPLPDADYVLVVADGGTGLFYASDLAAHLRGDPRGEPELTFPLWMIVDEAGESPLISVEDDGGEVLVAPLFTSPEAATELGERAPHLGLPDSVGTIEDADGLRRHALVAREAGARYVVVDPEAGETDAIPVEDLIGEPPRGS